MPYIVCLLILLFPTITKTNDLENFDTQYIENDLKSGTPQCGQTTVSLSSISFTLYDKKHQQDGILLNDASLKAVNPNERVIVIIHGWQQSGTKEWVVLMKDVYLKKQNLNVIVLDWSTYAQIRSYNETFCTIPQIGSFTGDFIYNLNATHGVSLDQFQLNAFSFGAQVAGYAGQRVFNLTGSKIGRINGLDAAGPIYNELSESERLDKSDANFVQAVHTNSNKYGYSHFYGTLDFLVNSALFSECGASQRGCPLYPGLPGNSFLLYVFCSHVRSIAYFIESINSDDFIGVECGSCGEFKDGLCVNNTATVMGENCPSFHVGVRYLNTNSKPPFAQGTDGMKGTRSFW